MLKFICKFQKVVSAFNWQLKIKLFSTVLLICEICMQNYSFNKQKLNIILLVACFSITNQNKSQQSSFVFSLFLIDIQSLSCSSSRSSLSFFKTLSKSAFFTITHLLMLDKAGKGMLSVLVRYV